LVPHYVKTSIEKLIGLLVKKQYDEIVALTHGNRLDKEMIVSAIREYGRELIPPPDGIDGLLDVVEVRDCTAPTWSVRCPLWTSEEGRSDLSLDVTVIEGGCASVRAVIGRPGT
jgi:hypothetical protein